MARLNDSIRQTDDMGRIQIPKKIRNSRGILPGEKFEVIPVPKGCIIYIETPLHGGEFGAGQIDTIEDSDCVILRRQK